MVAGRVIFDCVTWNVKKKKKINDFFVAQTYKPWIGISLLNLLSYSECSQNTGFHPSSHHLAIIQTWPSPPMLGFVDKVLTCFNCAIFYSHITWRKNRVMFVLPLVRHVFFQGNYNCASSAPLRIGSVEIII